MIVKLTDFTPSGVPVISFPASALSTNGAGAETLMLPTVPEQLATACNLGLITAATVTRLLAIPRYATMPLADFLLAIEDGDLLAGAEIPPAMHRELLAAFCPCTPPR